MTEHANTNHRRTRSPLGVVTILGGLVLVLAFLPQPLPDLMPQYAAIHSALEIASIAVAFAIFAVGWNSGRQGAPLPLSVIAIAFLGVALIDLGHVLSFTGMPDLVTPADEEKTIRFWLAARLLAALALVLAMFLPWRPPRSRHRFRWTLLAFVLLIVSSVYGVILFAPGLLPSTIDADTGLTPFKISTEYLVVALHLMSAAVLWRRRHALRQVDIEALVAAILIIAFSEILFTLYDTVSDTYALMGHLYKIVAYSYLFRALVIGGIETPYRELDSARARLKATLEAVPDIIFELDRAGVVHQFHSRYPNLLVQPAEAIGRRIFDFLPENAKDAEDALRSLLEDVHRNGRSRAYEYGLEIDGQEKHFEAVGNRLERLEAPEARFIVFVRDVTEAKRLDHEMRIAAAAFESQESICITDEQHRIVRVNSAFTLITGYRSEEVIGKQADFMLAPTDRKHINAAIDEAIERRDRWRAEVSLQHKVGDTHPQLLLVTAVRGGQGRIRNFVYDYIDISALKKAEVRLQHLALYDPLTGLGNRRLLERRIDEFTEQCRQSGQFGGLLLINLISFKRINDAMGMSAGDRLLIEVGHELRAIAGQEQIAYRQGADEFALIAPRIGRNWQAAVSTVSRIADRIFSALDRVFHIHDQDYFNRCRIGATVFDGRSAESMEILNQAAIALHQVKTLPDRTFSFFDERMQESVAHEQSMESDLRHAIRENQFELFFQPKVDNERRIVGAEALIRWHHPERGLIQPAKFIPTAEQCGLITPIEKWTLEKALKQLIAWQSSESHRHWTLSVNIASSQLYRSDFESHLTRLLEEHPIQNDRLIIEFTESTLLHDMHAAANKIRRLAALGVQFAIDDFGTGYSSLAYLGRLPVHELKIDQSFIDGLDKAPYNADIVRMIIEMAQILDLQVVAEGVETESQMAFLVEQGCQLMQGYLFGKPKPITEIERLDPTILSNARL
ncbi:bifunctional diguanylate cyclase/phosphodiesterase [Wenzhouxiangella sp. EGI_FJ10305]|uniref:bifunctional diguanylate cyclase/phosphodiesterase n=1 Tax=Wenzhouxiangella sp. EGI_FJ10305 TaxID=3243768 RepID=UPI0035DAD98C